MTPGEYAAADGRVAVYIQRSNVLSKVSGSGDRCIPSSNRSKLPWQVRQVALLIPSSVDSEWPKVIQGIRADRGDSKYQCIRG